MKLAFVLSPKTLPAPRRLGRVVLLDLAFAAGDAYLARTQPFIAGIGERLVAWIDHHPHPGWASYQDDPRFVLVDKQSAPACPELIDAALVDRVGAVDDLLAHGDFDGCLAAAKFRRGGREPYPGADADARAIDAPGRGFVCSPVGSRLGHAMDRAKSWQQPSAYVAFLTRICDALVEGEEPADLRSEIDELASAQRARLAEIEPLLDGATRPHPEILVLRAPAGLSPSDRKALLCQLEERAMFAVIETGKQVTAATFDDGQFDLNEVPGLEGARGLAWGKTSVDEVVRGLAALLRR